MSIADFLRQHSDVVDAINRHHILPKDIGMLEMYDEATALLKKGEKTSFVAALMAEKYGFSERHYYKVMGRLGQSLAR